MTFQIYLSLYLASERHWKRRIFHVSKSNLTVYKVLSHLVEEAEMLLSIHQKVYNK